MRRFHVRFADRRHAGRELAAAVAHVAAERPVVLGLPRGGVVVAAEVARALAAPLDVVIVRKLGAPSQPEYAVGAIGEEDVVLIDDDVVDALELRPALPALIERERVELVRRTVRYREGRPPAEVRDRTVVLVDDGVATGSTARVAAEVIRLRGARRIVLAVPVGPTDVAARFGGTVDEVVCLATPRGFRAVGAAYGSFEPTSDGRWRRCCARRRDRPTRRRPRRRRRRRGRVCSCEAGLIAVRPGREAGVGRRLGAARRTQATNAAPSASTIAPAVRPRPRPSMNADSAAATRSCAPSWPPTCCAAASDARAWCAASGGSDAVGVAIADR